MYELLEKQSVYVNNMYGRFLSDWVIIALAVMVFIIVLLVVIIMVLIVPFI